MSTLQPGYTERRSIGRRREDKLLRHRIRKLNQLFVVCQCITSEMNLHALFEVIMEQTNQIMGTQKGVPYFSTTTNAGNFGLLLQPV